MPKLRGHEIEFLNDQWVYADNKEPTVETWQSRPCGHCGLHNTSEGHDGCLGTLPNTMNACCGHGDVKQAYVQFWDDVVLNGQEAIEKIEELKGRVVKLMDETEYEEHDDGTRMIYRGYSDTEISEIVVNVQCPYCGYEWQEDKTECGKTYELLCGGDLRDVLVQGCGKSFKMHFDAN